VACLLAAKLRQKDGAYWVVVHHGGRRKWKKIGADKHRVNRGEAGGLSYYRDRDAAEADLVIEHSDRLTLVEAKSAQTASASLFDGANRVWVHLDDPSCPCEVVVAYGGR
jgi:hypothetical protein